ncbi:serine hydrolase [Salegentibacter chungangensis]|uniref:Serine hydrolase n=1 Tax=Salegentibacter chungangensis TaxID=1335724 RepID=A0ABW3NU82_9FLAO
MKKIYLRSLMLSILLFSFSQFISAQQGLSESQIDSLVEKTMKTFNVPGIAVAVLKDNKVVHKKGYGTRSLEKGGKVNEHTLFGVASNTKAFTSAALGVLIDQGKLEWDTPVTDIIPEFKLYDAYVTREFTVRDLLTHRSGLGLGAGDMMVFPASNVLKKDEVIHNLRFLKPVSSFRSKYDYDNLLYIVAGEVVERVSGQEYETFIKENFLKPLNMERTAMSWHRIEDYSNVIDGHAPVDGELIPVGLSFTKVANAAAGIYSSVEDMSKWVQAQLNHGKYGEDLERELFSEKVHEEMWTPQTIVRAGRSPYNTHFTAYGLGWFLSDVKGHLQVTHTGGLLGIVSQVTMIPEMDLGIIVLTNQQSGSAFRSITNSIKDSYFGIEGEDRITQYNDARLKREKKADSVVAAVWENIEKAQKSTKTEKINLDNYTGVYNDPWFGKVNITKKEGKLYFESENIADFKGEMSFYKGITFVVKWNDRTLKADAFTIFSLDKEGRAKGFRMEPVSPLTDFSFDFQDLDFSRIEKE